MSTYPYAEHKRTEQATVHVLWMTTGLGCDGDSREGCNRAGFTDPSLADWVAGELGNAGIDGGGMCVEVTETAAIVNVDEAKRFAQKLGDLGCEFALDDFGLGLRRSSNSSTWRSTTSRSTASSSAISPPAT